MTTQLLAEEKVKAASETKVAAAASQADESKEVEKDNVVQQEKKAPKATMMFSFDLTQKVKLTSDKQPDSLVGLKRPGGPESFEADKGRSIFKRPKQQ